MFNRKRKGFVINIKCVNFEYSQSLDIPKDGDTIDIEFKGITLNLPIKTGPDSYEKSDPKDDPKV